MACGDVTFGNRDEARQPRLRSEQIIAAWVERAFRHSITDRQQLTIWIDQKAVAHVERHRPRCLFQGREALRQGGGCLGRLADVPPVTLDRAARRRHPEQHVSAGVVAAFARECRRDVGHDLGLRGEIGQMLRRDVRLNLTYASRKCGERRVKLLPGHGQRAPPVAQPVGRFTGEVERVGNAGQAPRGRGR